MKQKNLLPPKNSSVVPVVIAKARKSLEAGVSLTEVLKNFYVGAWISGALAGMRWAKANLK